MMQSKNRTNVVVFLVVILVTLWNVFFIERDVVVIGGGGNLDYDANVDIDDANILSSSFLLPPSSLSAYSLLSDRPHGNTDCRAY